MGTKSLHWPNPQKKLHPNQYSFSAIISIYHLCFRIESILPLFLSGSCIASHFLNHRIRNWDLTINTIRCLVALVRVMSSGGWTDHSQSADSRAASNRRCRLLSPQSTVDNSVTRCPAGHEPLECPAGRRQFQNGQANVSTHRDQYKPKIVQGCRGRDSNP
jgi:hypothetical protein